MKRTWVTYLTIASFGALLAVLGVFQYRWLQQASESDGEKARKQVQEKAQQFAEDFNREIQNAYFNFQTEAQVWRERDWSEFDKRYRFWRGRTNYPDLISEVHFMESDPSSPIFRYDSASGTFLPAEPSEELSSLRQRFSDHKTFRPVYDAECTLVLPIHEADPAPDRIMFRKRLKTEEVDSIREHLAQVPQRYGFLVIRMDPATITNKLLPDLTSKHFGDGEFRPAVVSGQGAVFQSLIGDTADASAPLFDLSSENFILYANKDLMTTLDPEHKSHEQVLVNSVEKRRFDRVEVDAQHDQLGTMKVEVKREGDARTSVFATTTGVRSPWTLNVQHSSGSLNAYLASTFRKNLGIGFGILLLLAAAIAAIIISAQRAKYLAQRQVEFVSSVSHEFRTPLAVIYSAGENLADGVATKGDHVTRYGDLIKREGKKLSSMVEQILEFAGANSGRRHYNMEPAAVSDIVNDALNDCKSLIDEKEIDVETDISPSLPSVCVDSPALSRALQNLIANSVKYSNGSQWLRVSAFNGGKTVKVAVEDHGIGIDPGELKQIFEPFYRSRKVVDAQIHGNGLGLSLVRQIVEAHKGTVKAESTLGKGSKFVIELPIDKA